MLANNQCNSGLLAAVPHPPEPVARTVVLHNVSWETYERLLAEQADSGARLSYDRGALEIMILSLRHERLKHPTVTLVEMLAGPGNWISISKEPAPRRSDAGIWPAVSNPMRASASPTPH